MRPLEDLTRDLRFAARSFRRSRHNADGGCHRGEHPGNPRRSDRPDGRPAL
jgi:hypothetical protein